MAGLAVEALVGKVHQRQELSLGNYIVDLGPLNVNFDKTSVDLDWDPSADITGDGIVNLEDLGPLNVEFGRQLAATATSTTELTVMATSPQATPQTSHVTGLTATPESSKLLSTGDEAPAAPILHETTMEDEEEDVWKER